MKLVRFGDRGAEKPGLVAPDGTIKDCSAHVADYDHAFFAGGGLDRLRDLTANLAALPPAPAGARIGPPVARPPPSCSARQRRCASSQARRLIRRPSGRAGAGSCCAGGPCNWAPFPWARWW